MFGTEFAEHDGTQHVANPPDDGLMIGYARVSTEEQRLDLQTDALIAAGVSPANIYIEKVSGASRKRPALDLCRRALRQGDTLVVWKLDRLSRDLGWIILFMDELYKAGIRFRSLTEAIETATPQGRLLMHMIGAMAEFERAMIATRTKAGIHARISRGGSYGRKQQIDLDEAEALIRQGLTVSEVARRMGRTRAAIAYHFSAREVARLQRPTLAPLRKRKARKAKR